MKVMVLGGTGFVGASVCAALVDRFGGAGGTLLVPTRRIAHARDIQMLPTLVPVEADVHDDAALARLLPGCDAVVNLVAILHGGEAEFKRVHIDLPRRLAAACRLAGVRRVVHVSAIGADPNGPSLYLRSKGVGETALASPAIDLTILRPSVIFGERDRFLNLFAQLQALFPVMPLGGATARFQPVWVEDVARAVVRCLEEPQTIGRTYECAGPAVYTLEELVRLAGRLSGHARPIVPLGAGLAKLQAAALEFMPGPTLMSRDNVASMSVPNVATGLPGLDALGIVPQPLESVAPTYLSPGQGPARLDAWRARARRG